MTVCMPGYSLIMVYFVSFLLCRVVLSVLCSLAVLCSPARKGWPLDSHVWCFLVFLSLSHITIWCPGSDVVLNCIDFWSLPTSLLHGLYSYVFLFNSRRQDGPQIQ